MTEVAPLTGLKVVDMTEALAGPYCAMLLGDFGADHDASTNMPHPQMRRLRSAIRKDV